MPLISRLIKGVGAGIGLASEAVANGKEKRARSKSPNPRASSEQRSVSRGSHSESKQHDDEDDSLSDVEDEHQLNDDEAQWALDDAATDWRAELPSYEQSELASNPPGQSDLLQPHQDLKPPIITRTSVTYEPLPYPVILPQRRPRNKTRGFIRAYAPVLESHSDISQETFISFLNSLDKAAQTSQIYNVINIACFAIGFIPNPIAMGVTIAVQTVNETAKEIQSRTKRNNYLDQMNADLFMPRGLYCMLMTFKPEQINDPVFTANITGSSSTDQALIKATSSHDNKLRQSLKNMRLSSGKTIGEFSLPEAAPLVYPDLDVVAAKAVTQPDEVAKSSTFNNLKKSISSQTGFVTEYLDRRAQDSYSGTFSTSKLATALPAPPANETSLEHTTSGSSDGSSSKPRYASRFSDPNHPANSGTILGLLTGGRFDPKADGRVWRAERRARRRGLPPLNEEQKFNARMGRRDNVGGSAKRSGPIGMVLRKVLHPNVLYLTVVNLPSESEMKEIRQTLGLEE